MNVADGTVKDEITTPALGDSRARVLAVLREGVTPSGVRQVADRTGLHPNTARFHLDALVDAGLAERGREVRGAPGRPRIVYQALPASAAVGPRRYRFLAEILAGVVGGMLPDTQKVAIEAGRQWGAYITDRPPPFHRTDAVEATQRLVSTLAELGFQPEVEPATGADIRIGVRNCPFREVAEQHEDVVCSIHLGLMRGAVAEMRAPLAVTELEPFVEPNLCLAHITMTDDEHGTRHSAAAEGT